MKKKKSRRKFLEAGAVGSVVVIGGMAVKLPVLQAQPEAASRKSPASVLDAHQRSLLQSAMDELIPAGDGMPAASEVGSLAYLDELTVTYPRVAKQLQGSLRALDALCRSSRQASFTKLTREHRVEVLTALEKQNPSAFGSLQDLVYEAYYTRPAVWKQIGYTFYPTEGMGPPVMDAWNDAVLA